MSVGINVSYEVKYFGLDGYQVWKRAETTRYADAEDIQRGVAHFGHPVHLSTEEIPVSEYNLTHREAKRVKRHLEEHRRIREVSS